MEDAKEKIKDKFDLEERTAEFGEQIISFVKKLPKNEITRPRIKRRKLGSYDRRKRN